MPEENSPQQIQQPTKKKKGHDGPNFLRRLLGKEILVMFSKDGVDPLRGVMTGYNRYEVLINAVSPITGDVLVMKHAIRMIISSEKNAFEIQGHSGEMQEDTNAGK